jgi:hypothetical protein
MDLISRVFMLLVFFRLCIEQRSGGETQKKGYFKTDYDDLGFKRQIKLTKED